MFAAPFDLEGENEQSDNNAINKKRHSRTQKIYPKENFDVNKVNSVLQKIHNNLDDDDDADNFNPPPQAESSGVQKTIPTGGKSSYTKKEQMSNMFREKTYGKTPKPTFDNEDNLDLNDYNNYGDEKTVQEYYKRILPGYESQVARQKNGLINSFYNDANNNNNINNGYEPDLLMKKLNYMISLLEDQQDEKTNNVTEEVVLYSFLGIFIIFIADTFVKAGKYAR